MLCLVVSPVFFSYYLHSIPWNSYLDARIGQSRRSTPPTSVRVKRVLKIALEEDLPITDKVPSVSVYAHPVYIQLQGSVESMVAELLGLSTETDFKVEDGRAELDVDLRVVL